MVKSSKKTAVEAPVAGTFGKVRKHVVPRIRAQRQTLMAKGSVLGYFLSAKRGSNQHDGFELLA